MYFEQLKNYFILLLMFLTFFASAQNQQVNLQPLSQNVEGVQIECKLHNARILRENTIKLINQLLYNQTINSVIDNNEVQALLRIKQLLYKRIYIPTNLLPTVWQITDGRILPNHRPKRQLFVLFNQLLTTLKHKHKYSAALILSALINNKWDPLLANIEINLTQNINNQTNCFNLITNDFNDTYASIANYITSRLIKQEIISTTNLVGELFGTFPLKTYTPEVLRAESVIYKYILELNQGTREINPTIDVYQMIKQILRKLTEIQQDKHEIEHSATIILPFIYDSVADLSKIDDHIDESMQNYKEIKSILANNSINIIKLFDIFESDFPQDLQLAKNQLLSLYDLGMMPPSSIVDVNNIYDNKNDLLLAVLNELKYQSHLLPVNLVNTVQSLYINAKIKLSNNKPESVRGLTDIEELMSVYEHLYKDKQYKDLVKVLKDIKYELVTNYKQLNVGDIVWKEFKFDKCGRNARKCLHQFLNVIYEIVKSDGGNPIKQKLRALIEKYLQFAKQNGMSENDQKVKDEYYSKIRTNSPAQSPISNIPVSANGKFGSPYSLSENNNYSNLDWLNGASNTLRPTLLQDSAPFDVSKEENPPFAFSPAETKTNYLLDSLNNPNPNTQPNKFTMNEPYSNWSNDFNADFTKPTSNLQDSFFPNLAPNYPSNNLKTNSLSPLPDTFLSPNLQPADQIQNPLILNEPFTNPKNTDFGRDLTSNYRPIPNNDWSFYSQNPIQTYIENPFLNPYLSNIGAIQKPSQSYLDKKNNNFKTNYLPPKRFYPQDNYDFGYNQNPFPLNQISNPGYGFYNARNPEMFNIQNSNQLYNQNSPVGPRLLDTNKNSWNKLNVNPPTDSQNKFDLSFIRENRRNVRGQRIQIGNLDLLNNNDFLMNRKTFNANDIPSSFSNQFLNSNDFKRNITHSYSKMSSAKFVQNQRTMRTFKVLLDRKNNIQEQNRQNVYDRENRDGNLDLLHNNDFDYGQKILNPLCDVSKLAAEYPTQPVNPLNFMPPVMYYYPNNLYPLSPLTKSMQSNTYQSPLSTSR